MEYLINLITEQSLIGIPNKQLYNHVFRYYIFMYGIRYFDFYL